MCKEGSCVGVIINVGDKTVIGNIASMAQATSSEETPLSKEIKRFIKIISVVAITLGVVFFVFGLLYGYDIITDLVFCIGIIVANVPEGLLATVTVSLSLTAKRMASKYVLVKNLEAVETLGSTTCICSDKTGTLTENKMSVSNVWYDKELIVAKSLEDLDKNQGEGPEYVLDAYGFKMLQTIAVCCNKAVFDYSLPPDKALTEQQKQNLGSTDAVQ